MVVVEALSPQDAVRLKDQFVEVYREAFGPPPYKKSISDIAGFSGTFGRHAEREGFKCITVRQPETGRLGGFAYGYRSAAGQWWHDLVAHALGPALSERWLSDCFELVELALRPELQGQGLGSQLHDSLLKDLPYTTCALSTLQAETVALQLYRSRGWVTILGDLHFPGTLQPYRIMGKMLG